MIHRTLLMVTAIIASVVIAGCSAMTAPTEMQPPGLAGSPTFDAASPQCPAPGTGLPGALNMVHDPTMLDIPMARDADQGNAGMIRAVDASGC
jgi:hypothetical protein